MENEPIMKIETNVGEIESKRDNTTLFTHLGRLACYDHVFIQTSTEDGVAGGIYVFRDAEVFDQMAEYMVENEYPMVLNKIDVAECDLKAFDNMVSNNTKDVGDYLPEEWDSEG